jgi:ribonuclease HI
MDIRHWFKPEHKADKIDLIEKKTITIFTDGSAFNNGKSNCTGGIGVFFGDTDIRNISELLEIDKVTNNKCELIACIRAIEQIKNIYLFNLIIFTDSEYLIKSITLWYDNWEKKKFSGVKNIDLIKLLHKYYKQYNIKLEHVKAHKKKPINATSIEYFKWYGNMMADKLAKKCQIDENK